jgi:hypothetical protein
VRVRLVIHTADGTVLWERTAVVDHKMPFILDRALVKYAARLSEGAVRLSVKTA